MLYLVSNQLSLFASERYEIVSVSEAINILSAYDELGLDTETTGLNFLTKNLLLLQIGNYDFQVLFDIASFNYKIPQELKTFLNTSNKLYILQNAKFDLKFLFQQGILVKKVYDTMLAEIILTNGLQYSGRDLDSLTEKYCGINLDKSIRGDIITKGLSDAVLLYGANDVKYLPEIKRKQLFHAESLGLHKAISLDNAFVVVLSYVEFCGIKLDLPRWLEKTKKNAAESDRLKKLLEKKLLEDGKHKYFSGMLDLWTSEQECILNWDSPKQVIQLFKEYGISVTVKEKGVEKETIDAKVLEPQVSKFSILKPYLEYKAMQKEVSTYGEKWKTFISPLTGRIHTKFNQLMDTGRLSCGGKNKRTKEEYPNLQNLPSDTETRSCFIPEKGNLLTSADYSSQEQIVLANFSREANLINFYKKGFTDMHSYVAFLMYENIRRCTIEELEPTSLDYIKKEHGDKRKLAKNAGFAINYGGNGSTIAKNCSIPKADGEFVYQKYFEAFPDLRNYFDKVFNKSAHFSYVEFNSITKRKYFFNPDENPYFMFREAVELYGDRLNIREYNRAKSDIQRISQNYPIQG